MSTLTWADSVVLAFGFHGGQAHLDQLYRAAPLIKGHDTPSVDATIRRVVESHSSDSANWNGQEGTNLFASSSGKGAGLWKLIDGNRSLYQYLSSRGRSALSTLVDAVEPRDADMAVALLTATPAKFMADHGRKLFPPLEQN